MLLFTVLLLLCGLALSEDCAPTPISVPIGNVTLSNNKVAKGLNMSLGTPAQPVAFMPLWPLNNTIVYGVDGYCLSSTTDPWSQAGCTTFRGGAYDALASSTRTKANASAYPDDSAGDAIVGDASSGGAHYPASTLVADTLRLTDHVALDHFPLRLAQSDWGEEAYTPMMGLGLGSNSTLLRLLQASGLVASRTWSFFWGQSAAAAADSGAPQLPGSLVLGGYDRAKVSGPAYTQALTAGVAECPSQLLVTIADLVLNFPNGTDASIFPGPRSSALTACITPSLPTLMRLPLDPYFANFLSLTDNAIGTMDRSTGVYFWNMRYKEGFLPYGGDFTVKLQSGLSIRVPNQQLVMPHTEVDRTTGALAVNTTGPDLVIDSLQDTEKDKLAQLGWQFLTAAYLMVNQDAAQFSLWAANPTADEDLVAVNTAGVQVSTTCTANNNSTAPATTDTTDATATAAATTTANAKNKSPTAAIAGAAAGGACALLLLAGGMAAFFLRRRRRAARDARDDRDKEDRAALALEDGASQRSQRSQTSHGTTDTTEMSASPRPVELSGGLYVYEAPSQAPVYEKMPKSPRYEMAA